MSKRLPLAYVLLALVIAVDFFTKSSAVVSGVFWKNEGIAFGGFAYLPSAMRSILLSGAGFGLFMVFVLLTTYVKFRTRVFLFGLTVFFGGVLGNVLDRILYGSVVDFIEMGGLVFNTADAFQWLGILLVAFGWRSELDFHLPLYNRRRLQKRGSESQKRFMGGLILLFLCPGLLLFGLSYVFMKFALTEAGVAASLNLDEFLKSYVFVCLAFLFLIAFFIVLVSLVISRRVFGPIRAIEKYLDDTLAGKSYPFRLREGDNFKDLEAKFTELNRAFHERD